MTTSVTRDMRHTRQHPCPVCKGYDEADRGQGKRCAGFTNRPWARCTLEEYAGTAPNDDQGATPAWRHYLEGECKCGVSHGPSRYVQPVPEAEYDYRDESGELLFQVVRLPGKQFRQRVPDGEGGWLWKLNGARRVLYRLPELLASTGRVYFVEGEKDAETLRKLGLTATTTSGGAGKSKLTDMSPLRGREVAIIADRDDVGREHARTVAGVLGQATTVECTKGKDITEHLANGGTLDELVPMAATAPAVAPVLRVVPPVRDGSAWGDDEGGPPDPTKPQIVMGTDTHRIVDQLEQHMARLDERLFRRSHELVLVGSADTSSATPGAPPIFPLSIASLVPRVTERLQFVRKEPPKRKAVELAELAGARVPDEDTIAIQPPRPILESLLASPTRWPDVRPLVGVTESPMFRPDGTVRQDAGYDAETGYLVLPSCEYPRVPDSPTQAEAVAALAELVDVFCDFPYADEPSRYVPIAAALAVLARSAIDGPTPAFLFDASVIGSGKTMQCDIAHVVAVGRVPAHANWPIKEEEQEKLLSTYAGATPPGIVIDNVKGLFGGSAIEQVLTSRTVEFRLFGTQQLRTFPWRTVTMVSGNNVNLTEDMVRRTLMARLESPLERPQDRTDFKRPELVAWAMKERPRLVVLALTVLRAFAAHGWPDSGVRMASYQSFARIVGGAIRFAGGPDVTLAKPPEERAGLDAGGAVRELCDRWSTVAVASDAPVTLKALLSALYPAPARNDPPDGYNDVREALESVAPAKGPNGP